MICMTITVLNLPGLYLNNGTPNPDEQKTESLWHGDIQPLVSVTGYVSIFEIHKQVVIWKKEQKWLSMT